MNTKTPENRPEEILHKVEKAREKRANSKLPTSENWSSEEKVSHFVTAAGRAFQNAQIAKAIISVGNEIFTSRDLTKPWLGGDWLKAVCDACLRSSVIHICWFFEDGNNDDDKPIKRKTKYKYGADLVFKELVEKYQEEGYGMSKTLNTYKALRKFARKEKKIFHLRNKVIAHSTLDVSSQHTYQGIIDIAELLAQNLMHDFLIDIKSEEEASFTRLTADVEAHYYKKIIGEIANFEYTPVTAVTSLDGRHIGKVVDA